MGAYNSLVMTNQGRVLFARAQSGIALDFTKVMLGSGVPSVDPVGLTDLVDPKLTAIIDSFDIESNLCYINASKDNTDIVQNTDIKEIGLFATDPDLGEILYAYTSEADAHDILPSNSYGYHKWSIKLTVSIDSVSTVSTYTGKPILSITNLDTAYTAGDYSFEAGATGAPQNISGNLVVKPHNGGTYQDTDDFIVQIAYMYSGDIYTRVKYGAKTNPWGAWKLVTMV